MSGRTTGRQDQRDRVLVGQKGQRPKGPAGRQSPGPIVQPGPQTRCPRGTPGPQIQRAPGLPDPTGPETNRSPGQPDFGTADTLSQQAKRPRSHQTAATGPPTAPRLHRTRRSYLPPRVDPGGFWKVGPDQNGRKIPLPRLPGPVPARPGNSRVSRGLLGEGFHTAPPSPCIRVVGPTASWWGEHLVTAVESRAAGLNACLACSTDGDV
jgi:hypothetical protein